MCRAMQDFVGVRGQVVGGTQAKTETSYSVLKTFHLISKKISRPSDRRYRAEWSVNMDCFGFYLGAEALTGIDALCTQSLLVAVH